MLPHYGPISQAIMGTLLTWGLTAAGAGLVVIFKGKQRKLLDVSLGFAGGVMTAASYWSLLSPAIEMAAESKLYGENGEYAFFPTAAGFFLGALFVYGTDVLISSLGLDSPHILLALTTDGKSQKKKHEDGPTFYHNDIDGLLSSPESTTIEGFSDGNINPLSRRRVAVHPMVNEGSRNSQQDMNDANLAARAKTDQWKRILLLIVAITVHNIPG